MNPRRPAPSVDAADLAQQLLDSAKDDAPSRTSLLRTAAHLGVSLDGMVPWAQGTTEVLSGAGEAAVGASGTTGASAGLASAATGSTSVANAGTLHLLPWVSGGALKMLALAVGVGGGALAVARWHTPTELRTVNTPMAIPSEEGDHRGQEQEGARSGRRSSAAADAKQAQVVPGIGANRDLPAARGGQAAPGSEATAARDSVHPKRLSTAEAAPLALSLQSVDGVPESAEPQKGLREEVRRLTQVRDLLSAGNGPSALAALRGYHSEFPQAHLAEEAEGLRIEALMLTQGFDAASRAAKAWMENHPRSIHREKFQRLGLLPERMPPSESEEIEITSQREGHQ